MDDPTRWCENDTRNGTRLPGSPVPSGGPFFWTNRSIRKWRDVLPFMAATITYASRYDVISAARLTTRGTRRG